MKTAKEFIIEQYEREFNYPGVPEQYDPESTKEFLFTYGDEMERACIQYADQQTAALRAERDEYRKALEYIVAPLKKIYDDADKKGEKIDGPFAIMLIHDPTFLQNIAKESLSKYHNHE